MPRQASPQTTTITRLLRFLPNKDDGEDQFRGCSGSCSLGRPNATLSSRDERVLRDAQRILDRLKEDTRPLERALRKHST